MDNPFLQATNSPQAEYARRFDASRAVQAQVERQHHRLGTTKLAIGATALLVVALALAAKLISVLWIGAPLCVFVIAAVIHERVLKKLERCSRAVTSTSAAWQGWTVAG